MLRLAERHPGRTFAVIGVLCAVAYVVAVAPGSGRTRIINGDAIQYYAYLRSLVFDRDLDFANEYERFYGDGTGDSVWLHGRTAIGRSPNLMSIGPAILWAPMYLVALVLTSIARVAGSAVAVDGFSTPFQIAAGLAGIFYATLGVILIHRTVARRFSARAGFWGTLVAWLASPAIYYTLVSPAYSHAVALFTVALFVFVWIRAIGQHTAGRFLTLGILAGLAALVRWQDFILVAAFPALELVIAMRQGRVAFPRAVALISVMGLAAAVAFSPQLMAWRAIYGDFFVIPQGSSFMRWTEPAIASVLFSTRHGLLLWTPALIPAIAGLVWLWRRDHIVAAGAMAAVAISIYVNAAVSDWWAGEAFGSRRFVSDTVFFAFGLAALGTWLSGRLRDTTLRVASIGLIVYNLLFLVQYQLYMRGYRDDAPYPDTVKAILVDRLIVPFKFLVGRIAE